MCSGWNGYRKYMNGFIDYTKRILCGVLCLMLLLSGCGGQKEVDIFDKDQLDIPVADELPLTGEELMAPGRLLRMNLPDFKTLHPLQAMSEAAANVFSLIFEVKLLLITAKLFLIFLYLLQVSSLIKMLITLSRKAPTKC